MNKPWWWSELGLSLIGASISCVATLLWPVEMPPPVWWHTLRGNFVLYFLVVFAVRYVKHIEHGPLGEKNGSGAIDESPPRSAKFLLLMIPPKRRENLIGDLQEEFYEIVLPEFGLRAAQRWYWWQVIYTLLAFTGNTVKVVVMFWRTSK